MSYRLFLMDYLFQKGCIMCPLVNANLSSLDYKGAYLPCLFTCKSVIKLPSTLLPLETLVLEPVPLTSHDLLIAT